MKHFINFYFSYLDFKEMNINFIISLNMAQVIRISENNNKNVKNNRNILITKLILNCSSIMFDIKDFLIELSFKIVKLLGVEPGIREF